jgi:hypothetical protein
LKRYKGLISEGKIGKLERFKGIFGNTEYL